MTFTEAWKAIPETTVRRLRTKANLIKKEARNMAHSYDELRQMARRCRTNDANKIIPVQPYPNEALMEWFEDLQIKCGWIEVPETFRESHTLASES